MELLTTPFGSIDVGATSLLITVVWVVVMTNALNLIDGLDGLAGGYVWAYLSNPAVAPPVWPEFGLYVAGRSPA